MRNEPSTRLKRGWTTGACATAATKAALYSLWAGEKVELISIKLPKGEKPTFKISFFEKKDNWVEVGIIKDAGDDPDVTHGALIKVKVEESASGIIFSAGPGVGIVTKPGLPISVGEPAINPMPRKFISQIIEEMAQRFNRKPNVKVTISIPNGDKIAKKTWNSRLGIKNGLSILGTTGVVRQFSCAAWIASIHRGIDVAIATKEHHVAGCTGSTSEAVVQALYGLPKHAMLDMGDFSGGLLKYLRRHPIPKLTIGGGIGKMTKLAQGARDLHSKRSQVNFATLNKWAKESNLSDILHVNTALQALEICGPDLAAVVAQKALECVNHQIGDVGISCDIIVVDRAGNIVGQAS